MTEQEKTALLNALKLIKKTCMNRDCGNCPLRAPEEGCYIAGERPDRWKLRQMAERMEGAQDG